LRLTNQPQKAELARREREVLTHFVAGLASKEVAHEMGVSLETVLWYAKRIYRALKVHNRAAAVRVALERGLVSSSRARPERVAIAASVRPLVGRTEELATIDRLRRESRLICLVGMGGVGKTCLALEAVRQLQDAYRDGAVEVRLEGVDDEAGLVAALAKALDVSLKQADADPWAVLRAEARDTEKLLLLDNFEQLNEHAARLHELLSAAPQLSLLVTSRLPLGVPGETLLRLSGVTCPSAGALHPETSAAVSLFVDEARRRTPGRAFDAEELAGIGEVCRELGGMPLAIVLAACWAEVLPIAQIVAEVRDRPELLASDGIVPARHRRLDQVIDATLALRTPAERAALSRMSVFTGGFDRAAAHAVADSSVEILAALIRSSLLTYDATEDRYRMHPLVEERARAEAARTGAWSEAQAAHLFHYSALVAGLRVALLGTPARPQGQADASRTLDLEHPNVRRAWATAIERGDEAALTAMLEPLVIWLDLRSRLAEATLMLRAALGSPSMARQHALLQLVHDYLAAQAGSLGPDATPPHAALAELERAGGGSERVLVGRLMAALPLMVVHGRVEEAAAILLALEAELDALPSYWQSRCLAILSFLRAGSGENAHALATLERMLDAALASGELTGAHLAVSIAPWMARRLGQLDRIPHFLEIGEQLMERLVDPQTADSAQALRALLALWRGELEAVSACVEEVGWPTRSDNLSIRAGARGIEALVAGLNGRRVEAEAARAAIDDPGLFPETMAWAEWGLALACADGRDWQGASLHLDRMKAIEDAPWCSMPEYVALGHVVDALRLAAGADHDAARRALDAARSTPSQAHAMYAAWGRVLAIDAAPR
jgi:predicted ATPase/DNA-binding CsgD family transcriptional regulator